MISHPNYKLQNLVAFNAVGFFAISFVVFLASTQPFYLNSVMNISFDKNIGSVIGTLGMIDELTSILFAPLIGVIFDKINNLNLITNFLKIDSVKFIQSLGFAIIGLSLIGYGNVTTLVPSLYLLRSFFAVGITSCMNLLTVMLNQVTNSDFKLLAPLAQPEAEPLVDQTTSRRKNGKYSALLGISTGLGAMFAVSMWLPLPINLANHFPSLDEKSSLQYAYIVVGAVSIFVGLFLNFFLYDSSKQLQDDTEDNEYLSYKEIVVNGVEISKNNLKIQLAYVGSFVARSTTVATSVFIPLYIYSYYANNELCSSESAPNQKNCHDGYVFSAILTGVAQLLGLILSPFWGILLDNSKFGKVNCLLASSILGVLGTFGLCLLNWANPAYDPRSFSCFLVISLIGVSQIGSIISSMSLVSSFSYELDSNIKKSVIGSISGFYSVCGGIGILIITKIGGYLSDKWIVAPFFLLGIFNLILATFLVLNLNSSHQ